MKSKFIVSLGVAIVSSQFIFAQTNNITDTQKSTIAPPTKISSELKTTGNFSKDLNKPFAQQTETSREKREQAYVKLLEGQRYLLSISRQHSESAAANVGRLAKEALQKAVELDPTLAEAYTALAEVTLSTPPNGLEEALMLANIAVKINPDNYGGHRILARLYTIKSKLNRGELDPIFAAKAITEWKEIVRLDTRNAEAYAFLSELYAKTNKTNERIDALKKWLAAAAPLDIRFYQTIVGGQEDLSPENASLKLGTALLDDGKTREAIEILSRAVADNPENPKAIELLREAIESTDPNSTTTVIQALNQAVYANPENASLILLLAQVQARAGKIDEAAKVLRRSSDKLAEKDKVSAANLQIALGDIFAEAERFNEALAVYENALTIRGIGKTALIQDDERDFAIRVFEKMIQVFKKENRPTEAKLLIGRARQLLGKNDLFPDRQLIMFYRETGNMPEALQAIRALRTRNADDYGLLRLEAQTLTESGRVDEAVALIKPLIGKKKALESTTTNNAGQIGGDTTTTFTVASPMFDDFTNYLFISNLYSQAKRGREAINAANQALSIGETEERKQIAKLTLATARQTSGDFQAAEETLRELLKQSPGNPIALNNLGYFLVERNTKLDEALDLIQQAVKIDWTNPSYLDSLGWAYFKLGKFEQAEKYLKDALRMDASSATIHEHLGDVYRKQGKIGLAKTVWQKSLKLSFETEQVNRLKSKLNTN